MLVATGGSPVAAPRATGEPPVATGTCQPLWPLLPAGLHGSIDPDAASCERALAGGDRLAAPGRLAGGPAHQPGFHHLPDGQAVSAGPAPERPARRLRTDFQPLHGSVGRWPDPVDELALPALALRE